MGANMSNTRDAISRLNIDPATTGRMYAAVKAEAVRLLQHCSVEQIIASHTRETAAAHESGHAVVTAAEGMSVRSVRVCVERRPWGGETHRVWGGETTERAPWWLRPEMGTGPYLQRSRIVIAGLCGEIIAGLTHPAVPWMRS